MMKATCTSRRSFLSSLGVFAAAGAMSRPMRAVAAMAEAAPLPDYWLPHLDAVAGKVRAIAQKTVDGFWFITDLHITANKKQSGKALVALAARSPLGKIYNLLRFLMYFRRFPNKKNLSFLQV